MKISRRSMLTTGITLPALGLGPTPTASARPDALVRDSSYDPWIDVNRANLQHNVAEISRRVGSRPILAVIKNNGYGLGVVNVGQLLAIEFRIFSERHHHAFDADRRSAGQVVDER